MKEIIEQFISQIEEDQKFSLNTKSAYKSDLKELIDYVMSKNSQPSDLNQDWIRDYLKHLEETNKERNSFNRRASTFRIFLRFLYKNKLAPTNYSLIVNNQTTFFKTQEDTGLSEMKTIIENTKLTTPQRLILFMLGRLGLNGTQITSLKTFQVDFENKLITLSDTEKVELPFEVFSLLREYLLDIRGNLPGANEYLDLFLNENGKPMIETDIYKMIKTLRGALGLEGKLTTRNLKKLSENKIDVLSMQREVLNMVSSNQQNLL